MTKNLDNWLLIAVMFFLSCGLILIVNNKKQPALDYPEPAPLVEKKEPAPEPEKAEPPKEEPEKDKDEEVAFPCPGMLQPLTTAYKIVDGIAVKLNILKPVYFQCQVLEKLKTKEGDYYLVEISQLGFQREIHIVNKADLLFTKKGLIRNKKSRTTNEDDSALNLN